MIWTCVKGNIRWENYPLNIKKIVKNTKITILGPTQSTLNTKNIVMGGQMFGHFLSIWTLGTALYREAPLFPSNKQFWVDSL